MQSFKERLIDIFEVKEINESDKIKELEAWDSLTLLSIIATVDSEFGFQMSASDFDHIETIGDLFQHVEKNKK